MFNSIYFTLTNLSVEDAYFYKVYFHTLLINEKDNNILIIAYCNCGVGLYFNDGTKIVLIRQLDCSNKFFKRFLLLFTLFNKIIFTHYRFIYIRYPRPDFFLFILIFLSKMKIRNIYYEIPTYPFFKEFPPLFTFLGLYERLNTFIFFPLILPLINKLLVIAYEKNIFFKRVIKIENGVNSDINSKRSFIKPSIIKLISVINFNDSNNRHGLDRLLKGLADYNQNYRKVILFIVGDFKNTKLEKKISIGISRGYIYALGVLNQSELKNFYIKANIGIGNLGFHRISVAYSSSLKEREFVEFGLPYISSSFDYLIPDNCNFRMRIPDNDDPVDIKQVILFCDNFYSNKDNLFNLYNFSQTNLNWRKAMNQFIKYI